MSTNPDAERWSEICLFCENSPPVEEFSFDVTLFKEEDINEEMEPLSRLLGRSPAGAGPLADDAYLVCRIRVPRCRKCAARHAEQRRGTNLPLWTMAGGAVVLGIVGTIAGYVSASAESKNLPVGRAADFGGYVTGGALLGAVAGLVGGLLAGSAVGVVQILASLPLWKGTELFAYYTKYPRISQLLSRGWRLGRSPGVVRPGAALEIHEDELARILPAPTRACEAIGFARPLAIVGIVMCASTIGVALLIVAICLVLQGLRSGLNSSRFFVSVSAAGGAVGLAVAVHGMR